MADIHDSGLMLSETRICRQRSVRPLWIERGRIPPSSGPYTVAIGGRRSDTWRRKSVTNAPAIQQTPILLKSDSEGGEYVIQCNFYRSRATFVSRFCFVTVVAMLLVIGLTADNHATAKNSMPGRSANPAKIVIIGASYAKDWNPTRLAGLTVINRGVGGEQTHEMLARFDRDVLAAAPKAVLIWGFINDIFRSSPDQIEPKLVATRKNLAAMAERARARGVVPVLATEVTLPVRDGWKERIAGWVGSLRGKQGQQEYVNGHVMEVNRWIRQYATDRKITVLDFEKVLANEQGQRRSEYASEDSTHLSARGYEALTDYVGRTNLGI